MRLLLLLLLLLLLQERELRSFFKLPSPISTRRSETEDGETKKETIRRIVR